MNSQICGLCATVTATGTGSGTNPIPAGPFLVFVNNQCPDCPNSMLAQTRISQSCDGNNSHFSVGQLDFGTAGDGIWDISWTATDCPVGNSSIRINMSAVLVWWFVGLCCNFVMPYFTIFSLTLQKKFNIPSKALIPII